MSTTTAAKPPRKWFYPIQTKVTAWLDKEYNGHQCQYQDITKDRVYEMYMVRTNDNDIKMVLVVMSRRNETFLTLKSMQS